MQSSSPKCLVLFSGGLDSVIAAHLMTRQGIDAVGVHFILPFDRHDTQGRQVVHTRAQKAGISLIEVQEGEEFAQMVMHASCGYGKAANPCIDCRIFRLQNAAKLMQQQNADFLVTGEVIGQRPMSQRRDALARIEKHSGLAGLILRPLSAQKLPPTIPEQNGWVDRDALPGLVGRSRKPQMAYAHEHGLSYATPAGGCLLTQRVSKERLDDLCTHQQQVTLNDFESIAVGRHFRLGPHTKLIVGRNRSENHRIQQLASCKDHTIEPADVAGAFALLRGEVCEETMHVAARIAGRFSRGKAQAQVTMSVYTPNTRLQLTVRPATSEEVNSFRISSV